MSDIQSKPTNGSPLDQRPNAPLPSGEEARTEALSEALRSSFVIVKIAMFFLVVAFLASGIFTVGSQQRAIKFRFGKIVGTGEEALLGPGLHWAWPYPIDEVKLIPSAEIQAATSSLGWYYVDPKLAAARQEPEVTPSLNPVIDGYTLTGDGNIIHARATLRYRITDPARFYMNFNNNAPALITNALNNALFYVSAQYTVDDALRRDLAGFKEKVIARVNQLVQEQGLGITLEPSEVFTIPPRQVKASFDKVTQAENERTKAINEAQGYANEVLSKAKGEAAGRVNAGQTDRTRLLESVSAEARYFSDLLPQYEKNPKLFAERLQTEAAARVMASVQDKFFLPEKQDGKTREVRLQLGREPQKPKAQEAPKDDHQH